MADTLGLDSAEDAEGKALAALAAAVAQLTESSAELAAAVGRVEDRFDERDRARASLTVIPSLAALRS